MSKPFLLLAASVVVGCGGSNAKSAPDMASAPSDAGIMGQHGQVMDYFNLTPLVGFTVTDGTNTTTTDAQGNWHCCRRRWTSPSPRR